MFVKESYSLLLFRSYHQITHPVIYLSSSSSNSCIFCICRQVYWSGQHPPEVDRLGSSVKWVFILGGRKSLITWGRRVLGGGSERGCLLFGHTAATLHYPQPLWRLHSTSICHHATMPPHYPLHHPTHRPPRNNLPEMRDQSGLSQLLPGDTVDLFLLLCSHIQLSVIVTCL